MQFLRVASHLVTHVDSLEISQPKSDDGTDEDVASATSTSTSTSATSPATEMCEVCLLVPRDGEALVSCGHARFCSACADTVMGMGNGCPLCRTPCSRETATCSMLLAESVSELCFG